MKMNSAVTSRLGIGYGQSRTSVGHRLADLWTSAQLCGRHCYGSRPSTGEVDKKRGALVWREIREEVARARDVTSGGKAVGLVSVDRSGVSRLVPPLHRVALKAILERSDGSVAVARVLRGGQFELRQFDAARLSEVGIDEVGQVFDVVIAERIQPNGDLGKQMSFRRYDEVSPRSSTSLVSAADIALFQML